MERYRVIGSVDSYGGQQNLDEWIQMIGRAAEFAGWTADQTFKAAMFRLRGEAGEHVEQLRTEGKLKTWKELQDALRERFETAGKEQWHLYILNTGTQGSKTVQEWAQTVRKLSILAMGSKMKEIKEEEGENAPADNNAEEAKKKAARKEVLDHMRTSNFIRGLRSSLRQMVWRNKCTTFDEAVKAAAEEEVVEASNREEEVLNGYKRDMPNVTTQGLVEQIVAALEIRDKTKKKEAGQTSQAEMEKGATKGAHGNYRPRKPRRETSPESGDEYEDEEEGGRYQPRRNQLQQDRRPRSPAGRDFYARRPQRYDDQLPLPRQGARGGRRQEWGRRDQRDEGASRGHRNYDMQGVCYNCLQPGHYRRECPHPQAGQQGNGYRRLH